MLTCQSEKEHCQAAICFHDAHGPKCFDFSPKLVLLPITCKSTAKIPVMYAATSVETLIVFYLLLSMFRHASLSDPAVR